VQQAIAWVKSGATHDDIDSIVQLGMISLNWELSDLERVKLLVNTATQRDLEDQLQRLARREAARTEPRERTPP
jgi:TPR repeat protein